MLNRDGFGALGEEFRLIKAEGAVSLLGLCVFALVSVSLPESNKAPFVVVGALAFCVLLAVVVAEDDLRRLRLIVAWLTLGATTSFAAAMKLGGEHAWYPILLSVGSVVALVDIVTSVVLFRKFSGRIHATLVVTFIVTLVFSLCLALCMLNWNKLVALFLRGFNDIRRLFA